MIDVLRKYPMRRITVKVFLLLMVAAALPAQVLFLDDFETADFAAWDGASKYSIFGTGSMAVVQGHAHSGIYSFRSSAPIVGGSTALMGIDLVTPIKCNHIQVGPTNNLSPGASTCDTPANYSELYMRFFMQIDPGWQMPANQGQKIATFSGAGLELYKPSGGIIIYLHDHNSGATGTHALDNNWHAIEIHSKACSTTPCTTNDGIVDVQIDGVSDIHITNAKQVPPLGASTYLGFNGYNTCAGNLYFDDVVVSTAPIGVPITIMTVRRPNTASRTGIPVDVSMFGQASTDVLSAIVDGSVAYRKSGSIQPHERFTITGIGAWSAGDHPFTVQLASSTGSVKATYSDTLHKYKDGVPAVSIDENNNISRNGQKFFSIGFYDGPWGTWSAHAAVNTYCCSDYFQANYAYTPATMAALLATLSPAPAILPDERWTGEGMGSSTIYPGSVSTAVATATGYVTAEASQPNLLMWSWGDEMDMGPGDGHIPVSRALELTNATHVNDPDHPVFQNLLGYETPQQSFYHGRYAPMIADGRKWAADVYSTDTYPITYLADPHQYTIKKWVLYIDRLAHYTFGLTPLFQFVEGGINNRTGSAGCCTGPNGSQILMESWLGVIHGLKGINWWSTFVTAGSDRLGASNNDQYTGMAQFVRQMAQFQGTILGSSPRSVTSNTGWSPSVDNSVDGSRVDVAAWDSDPNNTLVIAARLSEATEPTPLLASGWTQTTCNGSTNCYYATYTYPMAGIGNSKTGKAMTLQPAGPSSLADQQYSFASNTLTVRNEAGAPTDNQFIAFSAGLIHAPGTQTVSAQITVAGIGNAVATVYGESRTVPVVGGVVVDQFAPAAVHIYQIPKPVFLAPPTGIHVNK
jgi:hypothetical protein